LLYALFPDDFSFLFSAAQKQAKIVTKTTLPIDEATCENDEWFAHPNDDYDVEVNKAGTHCRSVSTQRYKKIRVYTYIRSGWKNFKTRLKKKDTNFSRLALECFLGRTLRPRETVEHYGGVRGDHSKSKLLPRYMLFQCASRRPFNVNIETNTPRVIPQSSGYRAHITIQTPDGTTVSIRHKKYFPWSRYESKDEALCAAIAWQQKYRLEQGMIYV
jgi:hypothetical protein